jgi:hypothetical protein
LTSVPYGPPSGDGGYGIAVEIFDRRRIWIVHHLAMVATGIAVEFFGWRRIWIVHHLAMVASAPLTASKREGVSPFMGLIWTH